MKDLQISALPVGELSTNCYIIRDGDEDRAAVVDPGGDEARIIGALERAGAKPVMILLTHAHHDHILAVNALTEKYPGCSVMILDAESRMVEHPEYNASFLDGGRIYPDRWLKDGEKLDLFGHELRVIATPGHTEGSACFYLPEEGILFSGDTLFFRSYGRTDLPTGSTAKMLKTLKMLLTSLPEDTQVLPGHGPFTTIGEERASEAYLL